MSKKRLHLLPLFLLSFLLTYAASISASSLTVAGLPDAPVEDSPACFDYITGTLGNCDLAIYGAKAQTAWVAKDGTGDYSSPLTAMSDIDQWCPFVERSSGNHCLLKIAPGEYHLGTQRLNMVDFVDIEGSGKDTTRITGSNSYGPVAGMVNGANATLRSLSLYTTAIASAGTDYVSAVYNDGPSFKLEDIDVFVDGTNAEFAYAVNNRGGDISIRNSKIEAEKADNVRALYVRYSRADVEHSTVIGWAIGTTSAYSIMINNNNGITPVPYVTLRYARLYGSDINNGANTRVDIWHSELGGVSSVKIIGTGTEFCVAVSSAFAFYQSACPIAP